MGFPYNGAEGAENCVLAYIYISSIFEIIDFALAYIYRCRIQRAPRYEGKSGIFFHKKSEAFLDFFGRQYLRGYLELENITNI